MAVPVIAAVNSGSSAEAGTSHTVNLPTGIASGHRLRVFVGGTNGGTSVGWPAGWTERIDTTDGSTERLIAMAERVADGTEGSSITVTTGASTSISYYSERITGAHATQATEVSSAVAGAGTGTCNPPSITATWGAEDNLFAAATTWYYGATGITTFPSGYGDTQDISNGLTNDGSIGYAALGITADATDDPGVFDFDAASEYSLGFTCVLRPAAAGGTVYENAATADGVATTTAPITAVVPSGTVTEHAATPAGAGVAVATLYVVRQVSMGAVSGVATTTVSITKARSVVAASAGVASTSVSLSVIRAAEAAADGVATTAVSVVAGRNVTAAADGLSTTTVSMTALTYRPLTATPAGVATVTVDLATVRALAAAADGTATTTVSVASGAAGESSAAADGVASTAVSVSAVRSVAAAADGVGSSTVSVAAVRGIAATSDGVGTTTVAITAIAAEGSYASVTATSTTAAAINVVRALAVTSAGAGSVTLSFTNSEAATVVTGKYAAQHARAYAQVLKAGG